MTNFRILLAFIGVLLAHGVNSAPVTWTLEDVVFADGGTAAGSFVYDADTNAYSGIFVETFLSNGDLGRTYITDDFADGLFSQPSQVYFGEYPSSAFDLSHAWGLQLDFSTPLSNFGGTVALIVGSPNESKEGYCGTDASCAFPQTYRTIVGGQVSAVPIPAAVWLFGSALAGLGWMRRKQAANQL